MLTVTLCFSTPDRLDDIASKHFQESIAHITPVLINALNQSIGTRQTSWSTEQRMRAGNPWLIAKLSIGWEGFNPEVCRSLIQETIRISMVAEIKMHKKISCQISSTIDSHASFIEFQPEIAETSMKRVHGIGLQQLLSRK